MIKNERKVIDLAGMLKIVDSCDICRLGLAEGNRSHDLWLYLPGRKIHFLFQG